MDRDDGGTITASEWQREVDEEASHLPPGETIQQHQHDRDALFRYLDKNHDGQVTRAEWDKDRAE